MPDDTPILTPEQMLRMNELRGRETPLTSNEARELANLFQRVEDAEQVYLNPANEKLRHERDILRARNVLLGQLVERKKGITARLRAAVEEAQAERQAIDEEVNRIFSDPAYVKEAALAR